MASSILRIYFVLSLALFFTSLVISQEDPGDGYEWVYEDVEEVL